MRQNRLASTLACFGFALTLAGCETPGQDMKANVYLAEQVNSRQVAKVVTILAVMPAQVQVDNSENQRRAQIAGGLLGAVGGGLLGGGLASHNVLAVGTLGAAGGAGIGVAAGSMVAGKVLVEGVSITYDDHGQTFNSAQVGRICEYAPGHAVVVETSPTVTRIQSNATCPLANKT